jgi:polyribonucleotide nucleotidyltransferase
LAYRSVVGTRGGTVVTASVCVQASDNTTSLLTVEYHERHHAVGNMTRSTTERSLQLQQSKIMEQVLRPLLLNQDKDLQFHVHVSVQAYDGQHDPFVCAFNTVAAAMHEHLQTPVAAASILLNQDIENTASVLLVAITTGEVLYVDVACTRGVIAQHVGTDAFARAHADIQGAIRAIEQMQLHGSKTEIPQSLRTTTIPSETVNSVRESLGLARIETYIDDADGVSVETTAAATSKRDDIINKAAEHCWNKLGLVVERLFRVDTVMAHGDGSNMTQAHVHNSNHQLPARSVLARRERIVQDEIRRCITEQKTFDETTLSNDDLTYLPAAVTDRLFQRAFSQSVELGWRADGRGLGAMRPVSFEAPALPDSVHGSSFYASGETRVICTVTLGAPREGQRRRNPLDLYTPVHNDNNVSVDLGKLPIGSLRFLQSEEEMENEATERRLISEQEATGDSGTLAESKQFFVQYDCPTFSGNQSTNRYMDALQNGTWVERAMASVLPEAGDFPYSVRATCQVTGFDGSDSTVAIGALSLALLEAGVPIEKLVAGVSVGLCRNNDGYPFLLDLTAAEEKLVSMVMRVAGTRDGLTALEMECKESVSIEIVLEAAQLALAGIQALLDETEATPTFANVEEASQLGPKETAPCVQVVHYDPARRRRLVGPGGVILRQMRDYYGVTLDLTQEGHCLICGPSHDMVEQAKVVVKELVTDAVVGHVYKGIVIEILDFGAIIEVNRNEEGILHVSEIMPDADPGSHPDGTIAFAKQYLEVGMELDVMCIAVNPMGGQVKLSRRDLLKRKSRSQTVSRLN